MNDVKAAELYDKYTELRNSGKYTPLSKEVFRQYGICTFRDLARYLKKYGEYGGAVTLPCSDRPVLLPFHHDEFNKWLRFDNPRVREIYGKIYLLYKEQYPDRASFRRHFFHVEEDILQRYWHMPMMDTRLLDAPIAGCWDKMEIQAAFLASMGCQVKRFCFYSGKIIRGHTFILYHDGKTWNTCLRTPFPIRNKDLAKLCRRIFSVLRRVPLLCKGGNCELIEFQPPYEGMPTQEYIELIANGTVLISRKGKSVTGR